MALIDSPRPLSQSAALADIISRGVYRLVSRIIAWNDARRTREGLMRLTAHELDDIGLTRGDVDAMIRRTHL